MYGMALKAECRKRGLTVQYRGAWEQHSVLIRVSLPAAACGLVASLAVWGSNTVVVRACGYGELALFSAAANLRSIVMFFPALILRVVTPRLNYVFATGDLPGYNRAFWAAVGVNGGLALIGAFAAFLKGQPFVHLFGREFAGSDWLLALILASVIIEVIANNLFQAVYAGCRFWWNLAVMSLWTTVLLAVSAFAVLTAQLQGGD